MANRRPRQERASHLAFIRDLPSLVPGHGPVEAAHIRYADALFAKPIAGMQQKPSDCWTVPLAHAVHMSQHAAGNERQWWADEGIDPLIIAALLWLHSGDEEAGTTIIRNARRLRLA
jgi:hypothetical protein